MPPRVESSGLSTQDGKEWLDASKVDLLSLCPTKFYYRHELNLVPAGDDGPSATSYGTALHKGLEALYDGSGFQLSFCPCPTFQGCSFCEGALLPRFIAQFLMFYPEDPEDDKDPRTRSRGIQLLVTYVKKWRQDEFDVIAVEVPFEIDFGEFRYIGRIDLVGKWKDQQRFFPNDHKSASRFGDLFFDQFKLSGQITGYIVALEEITQTTVYEAQVNALRTTSKIDIDESFARKITTRTPEEKARWKQEIQSAWERLKHFRATEFWPRHAPFACSAYFKRCEYYSLCTSSEQVKQDLIRSSYVVKPWTPIQD